MKLAIVHDWIADMGGAERVLKQFTRLWPDAPVYTLFADPRTVKVHFPNTDIRVSRLADIPGIRRIYPLLAPLMPSAMESFDLSGFDTVLSSSVVFAKGVIVRPDTRHICYCYSPARMLWDRANAYERKGVVSRIVRHILRTWDSQAARRPDQIVSISQAIARRVQKYYRRDSVIVPPPVRTPNLSAQPSLLPETGRYFLAVGRLVPHKQFEMVLDAFAKLNHKLIIVGSGPKDAALKSRATKNVTFVGTVTDEKLDELYASCEAVIVPNEEDFGLTAVEAMTHGKPVLALRRGGALETVLEGITGEFFDDPIPEALADGIRRIHDARARYQPAAIQSHAEQWSEERFDQRMRLIVEPT